MTQFEWHRSDESRGWRTDEIAFKVNVAQQIDRVAKLFSERIQSQENIALSQKIKIDTIKEAVEALEIMMWPYCVEDDEYLEQVEDVNKIIENVENEVDEYKKLKLKLEYAKEKWKLLMRLMDKLGMLLERVIMLEEGFE